MTPEVKHELIAILNLYEMTFNEVNSELRAMQEAIDTTKVRQAKAAEYLRKVRAKIAEAQG